MNASLTQRKTPARLASPAARKLPRKILFFVMFTYILAGLFGRDPWKTDDVVGLATMLSALNEGHWLTAYIGTSPYPEIGPLTGMIGATFIKLFTPLFDIFVSAERAHVYAARLPNFFYFFGMLWGIWYGTYLLARRLEAQPLPLPFGGEPNPRDYGRMIADVALLFTIATVGIIIKMHETSYFPLLMAIHALCFYGLVRLLDHPTQGFLVIGSMLTAAFLTRGILGILPLLIVVFLLFIGKIYHYKLKFFLFLSLVLAILLSTIWLVSTYNIDSYWTTLWINEQVQVFSSSQWKNFLRALRDLAWFLWPTWPFAFVALWNWRKWFDTAHIYIPFAFIFANLVLIIIANNAFEPEYGPLVIGFTPLAAMAIPTLKRSQINLLDWYSIMVITLSIVATWVGWIALYFGWPAQIHKNIMRLIVGFDTTINWIAVAAACIICILWYKTVKWRLGSNPQAMWRGITLAAAGATLAWMLLAVLWLPAIDYNRSYREVGQSLANALQNHVPENACINGANVGQGQQGAFYVFAQLSLTNQQYCPFLFVQTTVDSLRNHTVAHQDTAKVIWQGKRRSERHGETFLLLDLRDED
ncbi:hypothetical protein [Pelistega sp. MC2]|uniref:hypothetical protein n=1 Tax=Pelistega sp. MC2 TaxID=1720297 RepID=UPI0008D9EE00|nr:hypothetical protein [Pelistega sp. MC2]